MDMMEAQMKQTPKALRPEIKPSNVALLERLQQVTGRSTTELVNEAVANLYIKVRDEELFLSAKKQAEYEEAHDDEDSIDLLALQGL